MVKAMLLPCNMIAFTVPYVMHAFFTSFLHLFLALLNGKKIIDIPFSCQRLSPPCPH